MKKTFISLGLIFAIIGTIVLPANASEITWSGDSLNIKEDINEDVDSNFEIQDTDKVIRVYNVAIRSAFTEEYDSIEAVLACPEVLHIYYIVKAQDGTWTCLIDLDDDNDFDVGEMEIVNYQALDACLSGEIVSRIAPDVHVYNTYYLSGETMYQGTAIYYVTDKGDYVHFFGGQYCNGEFLMPADAFRELQRAIREEISKNPNAVGGIGGSWDLSAYELDSDTFNLNAEYPEQKNENDALKGKQLLLWIGIPAGVCLLIAGTAFVVMRRRKKCN